MAIREDENGKPAETTETTGKPDPDPIPAADLIPASDTPEILFRAVIFLLRQAKQNNRDVARQADELVAKLYGELGVEPEGPAPAAPAPAPSKTDTTGSQQEPAKPTSETLRTSTRFRRR